MTIFELIRKAEGKKPAIHTGIEFYTECLAWFNSQGVRWNNGNTTYDQTVPENKECRCGESTVLILDPTKGNKLFYGDKPYCERNPKYAVFEYTELFEIKPISFSDLDDVL